MSPLQPCDIQRTGVDGSEASLGAQSERMTPQALQAMAAVMAAAPQQLEIGGPYSAGGDGGGGGDGASGFRRSP